MLITITTIKIWNKHDFHNAMTGQFQIELECTRNQSSNAVAAKWKLQGSITTASSL